MNAAPVQGPSSRGLPRRVTTGARTHGGPNLSNCPEGLSVSKHPGDGYLVIHSGSRSSRMSTSLSHLRSGMTAWPMRQAIISPTEALSFSASTPMPNRISAIRSALVTERLVRRPSFGPTVAARDNRDRLLGSTGNVIARRSDAATNDSPVSSRFHDRRGKLRTG